MNPGDMLNRAIEIAQEAHQGQLDKVGAPYFEHCRRVAADVTSAEEKAVAYLHDVVEKTRSWSIDRLAKEGFPEPILEAVQALTKAPSESHERFVLRAMRNRLSRAVKIADLNDNLVQGLQVEGDVGRITRDLALAKSAAQDAQQSRGATDPVDDDTEPHARWRS